MTSSNLLCHELQDELVKQMQMCKSKIANLTMMRREIEGELRECNEHFVTCFIQYELLEFSSEGVNTKTYDIMKKFRSRFQFGSEAGDYDDWDGVYRFNFGDIIFDKKYNSQAIVVNEKRVFANLWYYQNESDDMIFRNRKKMDPKLRIIKRCDMNS